MPYESLRSIEGPKRKVRRRPTTSTVTATLGAEGQRKTERAARRASRPRPSSTSSTPSANAVTGGEGVRRVERQKRRQKQKAVVRHRRQREALQRLAERTIPRLERERERLYRFETRPASLTRDYELERKRELAKVEGHLTAAKAEQSRLSSLIRTRRGRRSEPITGVEAASAILGVLPPVRGVTALGTIARNVLGAGGAKSAAKAARAPGTIESKLSAVGRSRVGRGKAGGTRKVPRTKRETGQKLKALRKKHRPAITSKAGRQVKRRKRAQGLATIGAVSPPAAMVATQTVATTGEALLDDPVKTVKTTARVVPQLPSAIVGDVIDLARGNVGAVAESQVEYWRKVGQVAKGGPRAEEIVQEDLGLVPVITGGLTGLGLAKTFGGVPKPSVPKAGRIKVRRLANKAENAPTARERRAAKEQLENMGEAPFRERHAQRKRESERHSVMGERREGVLAAEMKGRGRRRPSRLGRRESLVQMVGRLHRQPLDENISKGDVINLLGREGMWGIEDVDFVLGEIRKLRDELREPSRPIDPDDVSTRPVIEALLAHPEVLRDRDVIEAVEGFADMQRGRSVERHQRRVGREKAGDRPDPLDETPRTLHVARREGIPTEAERVNPEIRDVSRVRSKPGEDAEPKVRGESKALTNRAAKMRESAEKLRKKADAEERAAKKEGLAVRERQQTKPRPTQVVVSSLAKGEQVKQPNGRYAKVQAIRKTSKGYTIRAAGKSFTVNKGAVVTVRRTAPLRATTQARNRIEGRANEMRANADSLDTRADTADLHAEALLESVNRFRHAEGKEFKAAKREADGDVEGAEALRAEAQELRRVGNEQAAQRRQEALAEIGERIEEKGLSEPVFFPQVPVSDRGGLNVQMDYPGARGGRKERRKTGALAAEGRVDESARTLIEQTYRVRAQLVHQEGMLGFLGDNLHYDEDALARVEAAQKFGGAVAANAANDVRNSMLLTGPAWRKLAREGQLPRGLVLIPAQEMAAAIQRGDYDGADTMIANSLKQDVAEARWAASAEPAGTRKVYGAVPGAALKEFRDQQIPLGKVLKGVRAFSRLQTGLILGTSVPWSAFQLIATPTVMVAHNSNPIAWGRSAVHAMSIWRNATPKERAAFRANFGGTSADVLMLGDVHSSVRATTIRDMAKGADLAFRSPIGQMVGALIQNVRKGGPLMRFNRRYEAGLRTFAAIMEMDRLAGVDLRGNTRAGAKVKNLARSAAGLTDTTYRHMEAVQGLRPAGRLRYYLDNPQAMRELENGVNDAHGQWAALTNAERRLASVTIFLPFLRFSLRWMFHTFPRDHPFKTAILLNLSQQGAEELQTELGGSPSFLQDYGTVITHDEEGEAENTGINLARAMPGGNVLVEGLAGAEEINLSTVMRPFQPMFGVAANALESQDQYGFERDDSFWSLMARGGLSLSPLTRPARDELSGPSEISQLFRAIEGRKGNVMDQVVPDVFTNLKDDAVAIRLSKLLDQASKKPEDSEIAEASGDELKRLIGRKRRGDKAQDEIDALMRKYGVESKEEQRREDKDVSESFSKFFEKTTDNTEQKSGWYRPAPKPSQDSGGWYASEKATKGQQSGGWYAD